MRLAAQQLRLLPNLELLRPELDGDEGNGQRCELERRPEPLRSRPDEGQPVRVDKVHIHPLSLVTS
jgi:hypothetical protein